MVPLASQRTQYTVIKEYTLNDRADRGFIIITIIIISIIISIIIISIIIIVIIIIIIIMI